MAVSGITTIGTAAPRRRRSTLPAQPLPHHVLLDPSAERNRVRVLGMPRGMSAAEAADRIVASVLRGSGPILLCVPGTRGGSYETTMRAVAQSYVRQARGPVSVAAIPYRNGVLDNVTRYFNIGTDPKDNVLALVIRKLRAAAPHRPIHVTGESQGSWLIASTLREDPTLAAAVSRVVLFSKPGFVKLPEGVGGAAQGARLLGGGSGSTHAAELARTGSGILNYRHTDDVVASLFRDFNRSVFSSLARAFREWPGSGRFNYLPHRYEPDGSEAADWLLTGRRPRTPLEHESSAHRYDD